MDSFDKASLTLEKNKHKVKEKLKEEIGNLFKQWCCQLEKKISEIEKKVN